MGTEWRYGKAAGFVYLVESLRRPGVFKLGLTICLRHRIRQINAAEPVRPVWFIASNHRGRLEHMLKRKWADQCIGGEWFRLTPAQVADFRSCRAVNWKEAPPAPPTPADILEHRPRHGSPRRKNWRPPVWVIRLGEPLRKDR